MAETEVANLINYVKTLHPEPWDLIIFSVPALFVGQMSEGGNPFRGLEAWQSEHKVQCILIADSMKIEQLSVADMKRIGYEPVKEQANG